MIVIKHNLSLCFNFNTLTYFKQVYKVFEWHIIFVTNTQKFWIWLFFYIYKLFFIFTIHIYAVNAMVKIFPHIKEKKLFYSYLFIIIHAAYKSIVKLKFKTSSTYKCYTNVLILQWWSIKMQVKSTHKLWLLFIKPHLLSELE